MRNVIGLLLAFIAVAKPASAEIRAGTAKGCNYELTGDLVPGDADTLKKLAEPHFGEPTTLCLNSPGGSFTEALAIAQFTMHEQPYIRTVVGHGHSCYSACALVFMAGAFRVTSHRIPDRWLHVTAKLGFHAPFIDPAHLGNRQLSPSDMATAFDAAMQSSQKLLALLGQQTSQRTVANPEAWVHPGLIQRFLKKGRTEFYMIDTVARAAAFNVSLYGGPKRSEFTVAALANACANFELRLQDRFLEDTESDRMTRDDKPDVVRAAFRDKPGFDVRFGHGSDRPHCAVTLAGALDRSLSTFEFAVGSRAEDGGRTGIEFHPIYLMRPSTRLSDIPVASRLPAPEETSEVGGSYVPGPYMVDAALAELLRGAQGGKPTRTPGPRLGPSFDCAKNTGAVERVICGDDELSALDADLGEAWQAALGRASGSAKDEMRSEQRSWNRERAACSSDVSCMRDKYVARIAALKGGAAEIGASQRVASAEAEARTRAIDALPTTSVTFQIRNQSSHDRIHFHIYSEWRSTHFWPGGGQVWTIRGRDVNRVSISCKSGERVCWGAWTEGGTTWASGQNKGRCERCCFVCNGAPSDVANLN